MPMKRNHRRQGEAPSCQDLTARIDLHGYRKSEGVVALTAFLDQVVSRQRKQGKGGDIWVLVITGSGAHSSEGPILRTAVQKVLEKRQMNFVVNRGKGSFTVNANSGNVIYEPGPPVDTKVVLKDAPEVIPALPKPPRPPTHGSLICEEDAPTPNEVAATDKAIEASRRDQQEVFKEQKKDEKLLKRAVSMSLMQAQKEDEEEVNLIHRAVSLSLLDSQAIDTRFDDDLQIALQLSQKDFHRDEEAELQRALDISQKIVSRADEEFLEILELSRNEYQPHESWTFGFGADAEVGEIFHQQNVR